MKKILLASIAVLVFSGIAMAGHYGAPAVTCSTCHTPNFITEHGGFAKDACNRCHDSTNPAVITAIQNGQAGQVVTCGNCHGTATHLQKHPAYINNFATYSGVQPTPAPIGIQPTVFTAVNPPLASDYPLCLRCHSYNGFGTMPNGVSSYTGPSGMKLTDQAMEFSPNNQSAHPVLVPLNSMIGSTAPKALSSRALKAPWTNVGNQTMKCGDCHSYDPTGPQGANVNFMLKGPNTYWPKNASGSLYKLGSGSLTGLFCTNCHTVGSGYRNGVHGEDDHNGYACTACHMGVPHGGKHGRLIAYTSDPAPYNQGTRMINFRKSSGGYSEGSCTATGCDEHGGG